MVASKVLFLANRNLYSLHSDRCRFLCLEYVFCALFCCLDDTGGVCVGRAGGAGGRRLRATESGSERREESLNQRVREELWDRVGYDTPYIYLENNSEVPQVPDTWLRAPTSLLLLDSFQLTFYVAKYKVCAIKTKHYSTTTHDIIPYILMIEKWVDEWLS